MSGSPGPTWLPRFLFRATLVIALLLIVLVVATPLLDNGKTPMPGRSRLLLVFARDATLRRTAIASTVGLIVTAYVFFRPPGGSARPTARKPKPSRSPPAPPPPTIVGA